MNKEVGIEYKDFMYQKIYGNKEKIQDIPPVVILSDVHGKLGNT